MRRPRDTSTCRRPSRADLLAALTLSLGLLGGGSARAADPPPAPAAAPSEKPATQVEDIDVANLVTSAAKGVTTVQEAPAIITIITADEIKQRGFRTLPEVLSTI